MRDEESLSLWDHISGDCFDGPLSGTKLEFWPVQLTTVQAELERYPNSIFIHSERLPLMAKIMRWFFGQNLIERTGLKLPPRFRRSMHREIDPRRPEMDQGLGIIDENDKGKFYPMKQIPRGGMVEDVWNGRVLIIERGQTDGVPFARWKDSGEPPMQLLTRWYGFSFTYPDCDIFNEVKEKQFV